MEMLFKKINNSEYMRKIEGCVFYDCDGNKKIYCYDGNSSWIANPDDVIEADENDVVRVFFASDNSVWYKWKE